MIRKVMTAFGGVLAIGLTASGSALAQNGPTYTFNVPVDLSDVHPGVTEARMRCQVRDQSSVQPILIMGEANTTIPLNGTSYQGTISVDVPLDDAYLGQTPGTWYCIINLRTSDGVWRYPQISDNSDYERFHVNNDQSYFTGGNF
jgi:hypothetical protein